MKIVSRKKGLSAAAVDAAGGKVFTFGSYRLGVYGPGECLSVLVGRQDLGANGFRM